MAALRGDAMSAIEFNPIYYTTIILVSALLPGLAIGIPFLRKSELSKLEKLVLCFFIGMVASPALLIFENIAGLKYSLFLSFMNIVALTSAGLFYGLREGAFSFKMPEIKADIGDPMEFAKKHAASALLILVLFLSFWLRIQTYSPIYSELDPYFYIYGTGQIIRLGEVPMTDDTAWWPEIKTAGHRLYPSLKMYMEAQWYSLYTAGGEYNNYLLYLTANWLPPISAALAAFGIYLLFAPYFGKRYGILAASLLCFAPIMIFKMSAGVNEAVPFGIATVMLTLGTAAYAYKKSDLRVACLSALSLFACTVGSNYAPVVTIPLAGFIALQSLDYFARGARNGKFAQISAIIASGIVLGMLAHKIFGYGLEGLRLAATGVTLAMICAALLAFAAGSQSASRITGKQRKALLVGLAALALAALLVSNPIGNMAKGMAGEYLGVTEFQAPLDRTIAEQNEAGADFEGEAGFLALVPANHNVAAPAGLKENTLNAFYGAIGVAAAPFSMACDMAFAALDKLFNLLLGMNTVTGNKSDSLLFFFLAICTAGLLANHFARGKDDRDAPSIAILILLLILPITYIGINKIKYSLFIGITAAIAATVAIAELEKFAVWLAARMKDGKKWIPEIRQAFAVLIAVLIICQAYLPFGYAPMILSKSFETRYQDNPQAVMPRLAALCEEVRSREGGVDAEICAAGYDGNFSDSINGQYNYKICLFSQLTTDEIFAKSDAASQEAANLARAGASFRCNRLADYWVDSMEWVNRNLNRSDRLTSWWDYGHWTNYLGDRKTVLRNEHWSKGMIGRVAHDYIIGSTQDLIDSMNYFDSQYALFDAELIGSTTFGGKYGALNYLGCAHEGETSVAQAPGTSDCEFSHSPERLIVPKTQLSSNTCIISDSQQRSGIYAYRVGKNGIDQSKPDYCVGDMTIASGEKITATYLLDQKDENGDLVLSKGFVRTAENAQDYYLVEKVYNEMPVWPDGKGGLASSMEDATTDFYKSNLYRGFVLENLPGFDLVYKSKNGEVKIYRMKDALFVGNKEGRVDEAEAARDY